MSVRLATVDDIDRIVEMSQRFMGLTAFGRLIGGAVSPQKLGEMIGVCLTRGAIFVAVKDITTFVDGELYTEATAIGMLALFVAEHPFTGEPFGDEVAWWVEPEHRTGSAGFRLFEACQTWARDHGVTSLKFVAPADSPEVGAFYVRHGFTPAENVYLKSLSPLQVGGILKADT